MTTLEIWLDKLPEDKAKHYNRTRMSMELFAKKIGYHPQGIIEDFRRHGYVFDERERRVKLSANPCLSRLHAMRDKKTFSNVPDEGS